MCSSQQKIASEKRKQPNQRRNLIPQERKKKKNETKAASQVFLGLSSENAARSVSDTVGRCCVPAAELHLLWGRHQWPDNWKNGSASKILWNPASVRQLITTRDCSLPSCRSQRRAARPLLCDGAVLLFIAQRMCRRYQGSGAGFRAVVSVAAHWWKSHAATYPHVARDLFSRCVTSVGGGGRRGGWGRAGWD